MHDPNLVGIFVGPLEDRGIPYVVTGSVASIVYGEPRLTHDVDLILNLREDLLDVFMGLFPLEEFYCPPRETILLEMGRETKAHFNLIHHETGFKADCYLTGRDPLHGWALEHKNVVVLSSGLRMALAPLEYVIIRKLEYYREGGSEKHLGDIRTMLRVSSDRLDRVFLDGQIKERGLFSIWNKALVQSG